MTLPERLVAIHRALADANVPHAFGGAIALAYMTLDPRGTSDIDINVFVPAAAANAALTALPDGIAIDDDARERIRRDGQARVFWDETPVDLFFNTLPIHDDAAAHRQLRPFAGAQIPVLDALELAIFKALFNRTKDWADIEAMLAAGTLIADDLREATTKLVGPDDERHARIDTAEREASRTRL